MKIYYHFINFPLGYLFLAKNELGLFFAKFLREPKFPKKWKNDFIYTKDYQFEPNSSLFSQEEMFFSSYFKGEKVDFSRLEINFLFGSHWQRRVWNKTQKIPYGETRSYKFIAEELKSRGYRSVGQALGKNPLLIIIPCHRVIRENGSLGGFSAGLELKKYLLKLEGIRFKS